MAMNLEQLRAKYPHLSDDAIADLAALSLQMSGNKKTRSGFLGLVKEVSPETPIPELDAASAIDERIGKEREAREKFEQEQRNRWLQEDLGRQKADVRAKFGLSEEDMQKMEKMMTEKALPADYNWAAPLYKQQTEVAEVTNYGTGGYGPFDLQGATKEAGFEGLLDDPDGWAQKKAHELIEQGKKGRAPAF